MMNHNIVSQLESTNSRLIKEEIILKQMKLENKVFFKGMNLAYNKLLTFGVRKIPFCTESGKGIVWTDFEDLTKKLIERDITGHAARDEIINLMNLSDSNEWNYFYRRILQKDMRCGMSEKTINNVAKKNNFDEYLIPVFSCQLAQDVENHKKKMIGEKIIEVKLDGVRAITILYPSGKVDIFSRNGKELNNFEHIKKILENSIKQHPIHEALVIDGEIVSDNFQNLMKQIHRKNITQNSDANLFLFDILSFENFKKGIERKTYKLRSKVLLDWYQKSVTDKNKIQIIEKSAVNLDIDEGKKIFKELNKKSIINGYEGIMIKDPDSHYECKRSTTWLKSKPFIEISLKVKDFEEGTGRNSGKLGALIAEGEDDGKFFKLNVGSGFTDQQREEFWESKELLIGQIVEIRADSISQSQDGSHWSLRFPRFKTFRGYEINEKL